MIYIYTVEYMYIYPRGRRFTGNSCPKGVYIYEVGVGLGWGGVGMVTFLELAHMVGATQVMGWGGVGVGWGGDDNVLWTCTHGRCYASHGIGVGWGGDDNVLWTCTHGRCYASHGMGWGGDGNVPCTCTHGRCYASHGMGWGGVVWGW